LVIRLGENILNLIIAPIAQPDMFDDRRRDHVALGVGEGA